MTSHSSPESYISGELDNVTIKEMLQIYKNEWTFNLNSFQWKLLLDKMVFLLIIFFLMR